MPHGKRRHHRGTGRRHRKRPAKAVRPGRPLPADPAAAALLAAVAAALNACHRAGMSVEFTKSAVITEHGYVFEIGPDDAPWAVRTRMLTEFPMPPGDD